MDALVFAVTMRKSVVQCTHLDLRQRRCQLNDADSNERNDARLKFGRQSHGFFFCRSACTNLQECSLQADVEEERDGSQKHGQSSGDGDANTSG